MKSEDLMIELDDLIQIGPDGGRLHEDKILTKEFLNAGLMLDSFSEAYPANEIRDLGLALFREQPGSPD